MGQKKKYMQLYDEMVKLIQTGKLAPGDRLPTEQELSHTFAVSRQTVRQALGKMKEAGLISSLQGSGSFVSEKRAPCAAPAALPLSPPISAPIFSRLFCAALKMLPRPTAIPFF